MVSMNRPTIQAQQVLQAIQMLQFNVQPQTLMALVAKYDDEKRGVEFGEFLQICSYLLICVKLFNKFDPQHTQKLHLDMNELQNLGLWFL